MVSLQTAEVAVQTSGRVVDKGRKGKGGSNNQEVVTWTTRERSRYISDTDTNVRKKEKRQPQGNRVEHDNKRENVVFSESLHKQYSDFVVKMVRGMCKKMNANDPNIMKILQNPKFAVEMQLLGQLEIQTKTQSGRVFHDVNKNKVEMFLKTDEGMILATMLMEKQIRMEMFSLGMTLALMPPGDRKNLLSPTTIATGVDEGPLHSWWSNSFWPWLNFDVSSAGGRPGADLSMSRGSVIVSDLLLGAGAVVLSMTGAPALEVGAAVGVAALAPPVEILMTMMRPGVHFDMSHCVEAFDAVANDPAEKDFLATVYGINLNDFQVNRARTAIKLSNRYPRMTGQSVEKRRDSVLSKLHTRQEFYKALGVDDKLLDAIPEQSIYRWKDGQFEQTGTDWDQEIKEEYGKIIQGLSLLVPPVFFSPNDIATNIGYFEKARGKVLKRRMDTYIDQYGLSDVVISNRRTQVDEELTKRGENGGLVIEKQQQITTDKEKFTEEKEALTTYKAALDAVEGARKKIQTAGFADLAQLEAEIITRGKITKTDLIQLRDELKRAENEVQSMVAKGETIYRLFSENQQFLDEITNIDAQLAAAPLVAGGAVRAQFGLDANTLRRLPFDEVMRRVNMAYLESQKPPPMVPAVGWQLEFNPDQTTRITLLRSIAEARANLGAVSPDLTAWTVGANRIDESHFLYQSIDELIVTLNVRGIGLNPLAAADRQRVQAVVDEVRGRFDRRSKTLKETFNEEASTRTYHNELVDRKERQLTTIHDQMQQQEEAVEQFRDVARLSENIIRDQPTLLERSLQTLLDYHNAAKDEDNTSLDPNVLFALPIAQIMTRLVAINAVGSPISPNIGWPLAQQNNPDKIRLVIAAQAQWQAQRDSRVRDDCPATTEIVRNLGIPEVDLRTKTAQEVLSIINATGANWNNTPPTIAYIQSAINQARHRFDVRRQALGKYLSEAQIQGMAIGNNFLLNADECFLELDLNYQQARMVRDRQRATTGFSNSEAVQNQLDLNLKYVVDISPTLTQVTTYVDNFSTFVNGLVGKREQSIATTGLGSSIDISLWLERWDKITDSDLQQMKTELVTAENALNRDTVDVKKAVTLLKKEEDDYHAIISWTAVGPPAIDLSPAALLTLDTKEIIRRINQANALNNTHGWPKEDNKRASNQLRIIAAMSGARSVAINPLVDIPAAGRTQAQQALVDITGWSITENQLLAMTPTQIEQLVNAENARNPVNGWPVANNALNRSRLDGAIALAKDRLNTRLQAREQNITALEKQIEDVPGLFMKDHERLIHASGLLNRVESGAILVKAYDYTPDFVQAFGARFWNPINPADPNLSDSEKVATYVPIAGGAAVPVPYGYLDIMDTLFDHRKITGMKERSDYFQQIYQFLPPNKLAEFLNQHFNLGLIPAGIAGANLDIANAINNFANEVFSENIGTFEIRQGLRKMSDQIGEEELKKL